MTWMMAPIYFPPPLLELDEDEAEDEAEAEPVEALEVPVAFLLVLAFLLGDFLVVDLVVDFLVEDDMVVAE